MDGDIGFYTIKPDQLQFVNPLLILVFIVAFELIFYPILKLVGIFRPLQKMALGGILAAASFVISGFVEIALNSGHKLNIMWLMPQYFVVTFAEVRLN